MKSTPETVVINKAYSDLTVTCEKGDEISTSVHQSSANGATFGNILLGGIPGALVDGGSGAGYDYQSYLVNNLKCSASTTVSPAATNTTMKNVNRQPNKTVEERLLELKQLLEKGLISEDDAAIQRRKILGSM